MLQNELHVFVTRFYRGFSYKGDQKKMNTEWKT